jgi:hypothetical protein
VSLVLLVGGYVDVKRTSFNGTSTSSAQFAIAPIVIVTVSASVVEPFWIGSDW